MDLEKLLKGYSNGPNCIRKDHDKKILQFICCDTRFPKQYMEPFCTECQEQMNQYDDTEEKEVQVKSLKNFFETMKDLTKKQVSVINKNKGKEYTEHPLVKHFLSVLEEIQYIENKITQIKNRISQKLEDLQSKDMFDGIYPLKNQEKIKNLTAACIQSKTHEELTANLQEFKKIIDQYEDETSKLISYKIKGEIEPHEEIKLKDLDKIQEANSKYFKKEMTKYTSKIKQNMEEFFKALKLLFDDKTYDYFNTLHFTFSRFQRMSYKCSPKIDELEPEVLFQGSNDDSGASQFIASKDVVTNGVASCQFVIELYREGQHNCNFLYVGFIKDQVGWEDKFPWQTDGCVKEIYNDCNYPNMRVGYLRGDSVPDEEKYKKMSMKNHMSKQKGDKITMVCDKEEGSLQVFSPDNQLVFISRFTPQEVKENNWRFVIGFLYSAHKIRILKEEKEEVSTADLE